MYITGSYKKILRSVSALTFIIAQYDPMWTPARYIIGYHTVEKLKVQYTYLDHVYQRVTSAVYGARVTVPMGFHTEAFTFQSKFDTVLLLYFTVYAFSCRSPTRTYTVYRCNARASRTAVDRCTQYPIY